MKEGENEYIAKKILNEEYISENPDLNNQWVNKLIIGILDLSII
jgi:hypothetical protein